MAPSLKVLSVDRPRCTCTMACKVYEVEQVKPAPGHGVLPRISVPSTSASTPNTNCPVCQFQPAVPPPSPPEILKLPVVNAGVNASCRERPQAPPPLMPR